MAIPKTTKTNYSGISYYNDGSKGKVFLATFTINKKKYRKIVGYEHDEFKTNAKIAFLKKEEIKKELEQKEIEYAENIQQQNDYFNEAIENFDTDTCEKITEAKLKQDCLDNVYL